MDSLGHPLGEAVEAHLRWRGSIPSGLGIFWWIPRDVSDPGITLEEILTSIQIIDDN